MSTTHNEPREGKALSGVRVLELGQIYNGPYCGLLLAHLGADVIKIEPPRGDVLRFRSDPALDTHEFVMLNSSKRCIVLDLKTAAGVEIFRALVAQADVLIENFSVGTMDRLGLGCARLAEINPRLIYASGSGYGLSGPYADMPAMDLTVQAMSGVISNTGFPDGLPVKTGPAFMDMLGGIHLFGGIMAALYQRVATGRGQLVEVSMHDSVYPTLASGLGAIYGNGARQPVERSGNRHSGMAIAPYNVYACRDGHIAIFCVTNAHWEALLDLMQRPDLKASERLATPYSRAANMDEVDEIVAAFAARHGKWELTEKLRVGGIPCAPVLTVREVAEDPHLRARGMVRDIVHPRRGKVSVPASPIRLSDSPVEAIVPAAALGENTDAVLHEILGLDAPRLAALRQQGAIR